MNNLDKQYTDLLQDILDNGTVKKDRTGTGTISVFGREIRHKMSEGFPLLTTKKMYFKGIGTELIWFLRGDTNIKYLVDNDCNIWNGDAYKNYEKHYEKTLKENTPERLLEENPDWKPHKLSMDEFIEKIKTDDIFATFASKWGDLGPIYGKQWRDWHVVDLDIDPRTNNDSYHKHYDQIANLINDLKNNPDSRRLMVNAWNVGEVDKAILPPCHYGFQCWTRELRPLQRTKVAIARGIQLSEGSKSSSEWDKECDEKGVPKRAISLLWNQRSVDTFLGLPFNIASYGLLLEILAKEVNMVPEELIGKLGDTHIYSNHVDQAKEQISRESFDLPNIRLNFSGNIIERIGEVKPNDFVLENYQSHSSIKAKLSN